MKRAFAPIGVIALLLVVTVVLWHSGHNGNTTAHVIQIPLQQPPATSAVTVNTRFCSTHVTPIPASTTLPYTNDAHGLSMRLPYNEQWKDTSGGKLAPSMQLANGVAFGPLVYGSQDGGKSCTGVRAYTLTYSPPRGTTEIKNILATTYGSSAHSLHVTTIGKTAAVEWTMKNAICSAPLIELSGKTSNYILAMSCNALQGGVRNSLRVLETIARSIEVH